MAAGTRLRRLEKVAFATLIGSVVPAVPLRLLASNLSVVTLCVIMGTGACLGAAIGAGKLHSCVAALRNRPRARRWFVVAVALLVGFIVIGFLFWASPWPSVIALRYGNARLQSWAINMLRERGPDAIGGLLVILKDKDPRNKNLPREAPNQDNGRP
jgi:hypothetical protein